jgi:hypothetical protein
MSSNKQVVTFVPIGELKPHEDLKVGKLKHFTRFASRIRHTLKTKPLWVDRRTKVILDGHHRFTVFKSLGLKKVPCILVDYLDDNSIKVEPRRPGIEVTKQLVLRMGLSGKTFPPKTTKHTFKHEAPVVMVDMRGTSRAANVRHRGRRSKHAKRAQNARSAPLPSEGRGSPHP